MSLDIWKNSAELYSLSLSTGSQIGYWSLHWWPTGVSTGSPRLSKI